MHRLLPLLLLAAACAAPGRGAPPMPEAAHDALPATWAGAAPRSYEADVLAPLRATAPARLADADLDHLTAALDAGPGTAVRAAVLLGASGDPRAAEALLARLERRVPAPERADDAGDVVAAAALALDPPGARSAAAGARLGRLASGPEPHPDLEVRVECAAAALVLGDDAPIDFLLEVIRAETPDEDREGRDFEVSPTTAWARGRAAEALSRRAGVPATWSPDAPMLERAAGARALAEALGRPALPTDLSGS